MKQKLFRSEAKFKLPGSLPIRDVREVFIPEFEKIRQHRRVSLNCLVGVLDEHQFCFEHSLEISEGGLLMSSASRTYVAGQQLELSFKIPYAEPVTIRGEVIYVLNGSYGPRQVGIRFLEAPQLALLYIRKYVEQQSTKIY